MKAFNHKRGFTLIELLIYMAVLAVISVLVVGTIVMMMRAFGRIKVARSIDDSMKVALERIVNETRYATSTSAGSIFDSHPSTLVLNTIDRVSSIPTTIEFSYDSGAIRIKEGGGAYQNITPSDVEVTSLIFKKIEVAGKSQAVKAEITVRSSRGNYQKTSNFYDTIILRGSY